MNGDIVTVKNIEVGLKMRLRNSYTKDVKFAESIRQSNPNMDYLVATKVHNGSKEVWYVDLIDHNGKNKGTPKGMEYVAIGYEGGFDVEIYEPFNIDDMFSNLDKLAEKASD